MSYGFFQYRDRPVAYRDFKISYLAYYSRSMMTLYKFSSYFDETYGMAQPNPVKSMVHIFRNFFCKSNAHENQQNSRKNEPRILFAFTAPFDRYHRNMEKTYI